MSQRPPSPPGYGYRPPPRRKPRYPGWLIVVVTLTVFGLLFGGCIGALAAIGMASSPTATTAASVALAPVAEATTTTAAPTTTLAPTTTRAPPTTRRPTTTQPKPRPRPQPAPAPAPVVCA